MNRHFRGTFFQNAAERMQSLTTRVRTLLLTAGVFMLSAVLILVISALVINHMKNHLVEVAREEVRRTGEQVSQDIEQILRARQARSLAAVATEPEVLARLEFLSREGGVVMSTLVESDGTVLYQKFGDKTLMEKCPVRPGTTRTGSLGEDSGYFFKLEVRELPEGVVPEQVPITLEGEILGYLQFGQMKEVALGRLDPISQGITRSLIVMVALVLACLGVAVFLLFRVNCRQLDLQARHEETVRMAQIGTLASSLAHEIRNPLHAINLHLDAAREELEEPREGSIPQATRVIGSVQRQILSLNNIVSNFMNYALPGQIEREPIRLSALLGEVIMFLEPEFTSRAVHVERHVPENAWILGDSTALRQVLVNVLLNGAQALEKQDGERRLVVRATQADSLWRLIVDDNGLGLPEGQEEAIFDVFVSHRKGGSGFGLAIARRIMEQHAGAISGMTRPEGGARFVLEFHATTPQPLPATSAVATPAVVG